MLKALFLDMDETLCDTTGANLKAQASMAMALRARYGAVFAGSQLATAYVKGIYRQWEGGQKQRYMSIIKQEGEVAFRVQLLCDLLVDFGASDITVQDVELLQKKFDQDRIKAFSFYPGIVEFLTEASALFTLVVITNGPTFSQLPKIKAIRLSDYVDHIIIGGQEPEQKPAPSIFKKALKLAKCEAHEAIHVGDSLKADIAGAHNSGITSVWIQHQQPLDAELGINPSHTVMSPEEIPALIKELHAG
ncbi:MAG: HAD family hydrolase [Endozoicomonas sp. (ex Botrylloides leachii)]|nr:HAD family hydrolase [Endozoicomonas sp. (ex Botrylloides leachii)]